MDYKKYSLENLENWLHDAMSSAEATPQEIYDTIKKVVEEEQTYHTQRAAKTTELLSLLNGHRSVSFINENNSTDSWTKEDVLRQRDYYESNNSVIDFTNLGASDTITFTSCDSTNTSPECSQHWNSFWNDQYQTPKDTQYVSPQDAMNNLAFTQVGDFTVYNNATKDSFISRTSSPFVSEDGDLFSHINQGVKADGYSVNGVSHSKYWYEYDRNDPNRKNPFSSTEDKVTKWVLPVELDGLTGDCVVTLPDDLLERVGWVEGDTVEFVSNTNGSFTVKKVVKSVVENT
jgi:hypothetical protein